MNYIKKKIKGSSSKKGAAAAAEDDDDFDPNLFHVLQRPAEGAPEGWVPYDDRIDEESEEWRAFRQLTQRVTETLVETKENLSKIVASTAITETSREWQIRTITAAGTDTDTGTADSHDQDNTVSAAERPVNGVTIVSFPAVKPDRPAPPRPPPPSVQLGEDRFEAAFPSSNFAANDFEVKRPAPPRPVKPPQAPASSQLEFDLRAEFGFDPVVKKQAAPPVSSLFLDDDHSALRRYVDDGPDPFDTSFVAEVAQGPTITSSKLTSDIKGVISDEHLDSYGADADADDPFVIKDVDVAVIVPESEELESDFFHLNGESSSVDKADIANVADIKGIILDDSLDAYGIPALKDKDTGGSGFGDVDDNDDDPFVVKDVVVIPDSEKEDLNFNSNLDLDLEDSDVDVEAKLQTADMDPFESFLQNVAQQHQQQQPRTKSPNPFLMDDREDVVTSSSSNPFTGAPLSNDDDNDPFATRLAPNPFASVVADSTTTAATDLFAFDDGNDADNAVANDHSNPFASFSQPEVGMSIQQEQQPLPLLPESTFDPFSATDVNGSKSSCQVDGSGFQGDQSGSSFGLASRFSIPAAPSSQDLFGLGDNESEDPFQTDVKPEVAVVDDDVVVADAKASIGNVEIDDVICSSTGGPPNGAPNIDFFNADTAVVNVSGVSVELSEVSPAAADDFDGFFGDDSAVGQQEPEDKAPDVTVVDIKQPTTVTTTTTSSSNVPPPRPPPPSGAKPSRPPPPKVIMATEPETAKPLDLFSEEPDNELPPPLDTTQSWDAFTNAAPMPDSQEDPFGMVSAIVNHENEMSIDRRKSGTFDTYERRVSAGQTNELLSCFETSVAPIAPAIAQAAIEEVDFFGDVAAADDGRGIAGAMKPSTGDVFCGPLTLSDRQSLDTVDVEATIIEPDDIRKQPPPPRPPQPPSLPTTTETMPPPPTTTTATAEELACAEMAAFDAFEAKFQSTSETSSGAAAFGDVFGGGADFGDGDGSFPMATAGDVPQGFEISDDFDQFFALKEPPAAPKPSPARFAAPVSQSGTAAMATEASATIEPTVATVKRTDDSSSDSDDTGNDFSVFIRPKMKDKDDAANLHLGPIPALAPPPKSPMRSPPSHTSPRFNPFDKEPGESADDARGFVDVDTFEAAFSTPIPPADLHQTPHDLAGLTGAATPPTAKVGASQSVDSQDSPGSPLFELDDSEPLEDFYVKRESAQGWDLMLRQPSKKKLTGQRFWKKVYVTISDNGVLHLYNKSDDKDAFQELPLQACYSLTEIGAQQYDTYGKIFTVKLQYVFYRERVGVRPGQISKVTHGQVTSLGQLAKLGLPLEHSPQVSQLLKLGTQQYEELRVFIREVEDSLFRLSVHRDRALTYKTEEVQVTVVDELRAEVQASGVVLSQVARVRVFFLAFIVGMPDVELGLNDITKQGREVVGRHDIIPVVTEEWIRLEKCEFHSCVSVSDFEKTRTIKFHPPDACFFEILRFRIRPPKNRELPLQVKATMSIIGNRVEIRADVLVPGCISRKHGQIPCEDVAIRFPLPECWIYLFRVEKHFRYGSLKSAARKPGKIKGLERIMGAGLTMEPSMIEVSTGQAKYEHQHRAIVWRVPRLPKEGQGAYTTQLFVCRMELTSYDQIPAELDSHVHVEFTMPATTASHTTVRSVSVTNPNPPEKYVKYLARHKYRIEIEHVTATSECDYVAATTTGKGQSNSAQGHGASSDSSNQ